MSFQKINQEDTQKPEGRECILIYGFGGKDFIKFKSYCAMIGIRDIIQIEKDMLDEKINNILDGNITKMSGEQAPTNRAIVLNAFSGQKLNTFIGNFKRTGLTQPLIATVTPTSTKWTFRELVDELQKERAAIAKSTQALNEENHKNFVE